MTDKYRGKSMDRRYSGEAVDITYNLKRCIHAAECVRRLSEVFNTQRRPWITADGASADQVAATVEHCPSGALHYERKDGGSTEHTPSTNRVVIWHNGPLQFSGDLRIEGAAVDVQDETRAALCRCGASHNKPFCDNSHKDIAFDGRLGAPLQAVPNEEGGTLRITVNPNGSLRIEGAFTLYDEQGNALFSGSETWLCRCGGSQDKPFCDGSHRANSFKAE
jgi:CDGSH-type Zn-finger protein/uncharacterized Fe-S cluster protein YjdI